MIRTKDKILAEVNDPDTVILSGPMSTNQLIIGAGNKSVKCNPYQAGLVLLASDKSGNLRIIRFDDKPNVVIGTDANGEIVLYDRSTVE